jgi:hypothetical protein
MNFLGQRWHKCWYLFGSLLCTEKMWAW